jgi:hypothetical protein
MYPPGNSRVGFVRALRSSGLKVFEDPAERLVIPLWLGHEQLGVDLRRKAMSPSSQWGVVATGGGYLAVLVQVFETMVSERKGGRGGPRRERRGDPRRRMLQGSEGREREREREGGKEASTGCRRKKSSALVLVRSREGENLTDEAEVL